MSIRASIHRVRSHRVGVAGPVGLEGDEQYRHEGSACVVLRLRRESRPLRTYGSSLMIIEGHPDKCPLAHVLRTTFWRLR